MNTRKIRPEDHVSADTIAKLGVDTFEWYLIGCPENLAKELRIQVANESDKMEHLSDYIPFEACQSPEEVDYCFFALLFNECFHIMAIYGLGVMQLMQTEHRARQEEDPEGHTPDGTFPGGRMA